MRVTIAFVSEQEISGDPIWARDGVRSEESRRGTGTGLRKLVGCCRPTVTSLTPAVVIDFGVVPCSLNPESALEFDDDRVSSTSGQSLLHPQGETNI